MSTATPGPIVLDTRDVADVDALGRGRLRANDLVHERGEVRLQRFDAERDLADRRVHVAALVDAELDLAGLRLRTALPTLNVTVPAFGFGMRPRGPSTRPSWPSWPIWSGVAISTSKSSQPSLIFWMYSAPTKSAPAASRFTRLVADGDDEHANRLAGARRQHDGAAHDLIGVTRIDAEAHARPRPSRRTWRTPTS